MQHLLHYQAVYYIIELFYYIIGQLLHYTVFLLHYHEQVIIALLLTNVIHMGQYSHITTNLSSEIVSLHLLLPFCGRDHRDM